jgi:hypothetical protein
MVQQTPLLWLLLALLITLPLTFARAEHWWLYDWYLPARYELDIAYFNLKPLRTPMIQAGAVTSIQCHDAR